MPSTRKTRSLLLAGVVRAAVAPLGMATEQAKPKPFTVAWAPGNEGAQRHGFPSVDGAG